MVIPSHFSFFPSYRLVLSLPFCLFLLRFLSPSNSLMFCVIVYISLICHPFFHCMFLLSLYHSLSLSLFSFFLFFLFFFLSLSLSISLYSLYPLSLSPCICLCLPLSVLMGERKGDTKKIKMRETLAKKRLGGNSRRKSQHMRTRRNRTLTRTI